MVTICVIMSRNHATILQSKTQQSSKLVLVDQDQK